MKMLRRNLSQARRGAQKGFTLIELAIVGIFLGLLAIFAVSQFSGSATDTTRANGLADAAQKISDNWALVAQTCGLSSDVTALNLKDGSTTGAAAGNLSVILGTAAPATTYANCITQSGVRPLANMAVGTAGSETVYGYPVTLTKTTVDGTAGSRAATGVVFAEVPENVTLALYNKFSSAVNASTAAAVPATENTTDPSIRFSANTGGKRTVTLVRTQ